MMKSFFKKLAFVMALAMVVTLAAPAAQTAVAAEDKKPLAIAYQKGAVITALNLVEVGDTEDLRFVYAPENWKELDIAWSSSNPNVVSVDEKTGEVKAEAAGQATISVAVGTETASVEVYSVDTTTFVATMGTKEDREITELTLTVGEDFDFAFFGIKDYSVDRYRCDWFAVDPDGVIELDDTNGFVTAKKAGSAKLSLAVYNLVTGLKTDVAPCVITVKDVEPEVAPNDFEITKMLSDSSFQLTFANKEITKAELEKGLSVYYYIGAQRIQYNYPRTVEVKDGVATVKFYSLVSDGTTYGFKYADIEKETTVKIGEPASMYLTWKDLGGTNHANVAYAGYNTLLEPHILNAEEAEITDTILNTPQGRYVEYKLADTSVAAQYYMQDNNKIYFTAANQTALVVATLYNGFNSLGQRVESVSTVPTAITSTTRPIRTFAFQEAIAASLNGNVWDNVRKFAVGDAGKTFSVRLKDNYGKDVTVQGGNMTHDSEAGLGVFDTGLGGLVTTRYVGRFSFVSDNIGIFTIDANSGYMVANKAGQANVLVYYDPDTYNTTTADKILVAVVPITTYDRRVATTFTVDSNYRTVSTEGIAAGRDGAYNETTFKITIKDQLGDKINVNMGDLVVETVTDGRIVPVPEVDPINHVGTGEYEVKITCNYRNVEYIGGSRAIYYRFKYKNAEKVTFTANVIRPNLALQASSYGFESGTCHPWRSNDINPFIAGNGANHSISASLFVYKNGVKVAKENVSLMTSGLWTNPSAATLDRIYVKVLKNGVDVTEKIIGNGTATEAAIQRSSTDFNKVTVSLSKTGIATEDGFSVVDNALGAGSYNILAYKAVRTSANTDNRRPDAMQLVASTTVEVKDSKLAVTYAGKITDATLTEGGDYNIGSGAYDNVQARLNAIAKASFAVKVGDHVCKMEGSYSSWKNVQVHANAVQYNSRTTYFESLEIYVPVGGVDGNPANGYVRYVVPVGDYVITK